MYRVPTVSFVLLPRHIHAHDNFFFFCSLYSRSSLRGFPRWRFRPIRDTLGPKELVGPSLTFSWHKWEECILFRSVYLWSLYGLHSGLFFFAKTRKPDAFNNSAKKVARPQKFWLLLSLPHADNENWLAHGEKESKGKRKIEKEKERTKEIRRELLPTSTEKKIFRETRRSKTKKAPIVNLDSTGAVFADAKQICNWLMKRMAFLCYSWNLPGAFLSVKISEGQNRSGESIKWLHLNTTNCSLLAFISFVARLFLPCND